MSLSRQLFNEFRPLFRMLDEPFYVPTAALIPTQATRDFGFVRTPQVHLTDEKDHFVVEAELPGVPKENIDVSISDNGRSLTIKGSTFASSEAASTTEGVPSTTAPSTATSPSAEATSDTTSTPVPATESKNGTEPPMPTATDASTGNVAAGASDQPSPTTPAPRVSRSSRSSFARTIWLPKPVDAAKVTAKLDNGVLTLDIPKLQNANHRITVA